jgi:hypothetical protein
MAGLVPAIHVFFTVNFKEDVDTAISAGVTRMGQIRG